MTPTFNVYGFRFSIRSAAGEAIEGLQQDFAFFRSSDPGDGVTVELLVEDPPREGLPLMDASVYTPRNVVYRNGSKRYIDYHGRAMGIQDEASGDLKLYSRDPNLLYEAAYLYLLSRIGQHLDRQGLHRIHALGVTIQGRAVLLLPGSRRFNHNIVFIFSFGFLLFGICSDGKFLVFRAGEA